MLSCFFPRTPELGTTPFTYLLIKDSPFGPSDDQRPFSVTKEVHTSEGCVSYDGVDVDL